MVIKHVVLAELKPVFPASGSYLVSPRHGPLVIASVLKRAGYDITYLNESIVGKITSELIESYDPDIVAFTAITASVSRVREMAEELSDDGLEIILGGEHASMFPTSVGFVDYVIVKEGDRVIVPLLEALNEGRDLSDIPNLGHYVDGSFVLNPVLDSSTLPIDFRYDYSVVEGLDSLSFAQRLSLRLPLQTSRGCVRSCRFCPTSFLFGKGYRRRPLDDIKADIEAGLEIAKNPFIPRTPFMIVDNSFGQGETETMAMLEGIIAEDYRARFTVLLTEDTARNRNLVKMMRKAGVTNVSLGIEFLDERSLSAYSKGQSVANTIDAINVLRDNGISILGLFMAGSDYDTAESVRRIPEFALEHGVSKVQISPITSYNFGPAAEGLEPVFPDYRLIPGISSDFHNGHFVTIFPSHIRPSVLQEEIERAYEEFYSRENTWKLVKDSNLRFKERVGRTAVGIVENRVCQAIREAEIRGQGYIEFLREVERPFYSENTLVEDRLIRAKPRKDRPYN